MALLGPAAAEAQAELIASLTQDEIPIKLRCAICSRLAVNAFRLPCCDQAICETCQSTLPSSCPVCEHTPVAAEDCKPNKSLRTTIKVFLRTEEKKREAVKLKAAKESPALLLQTPVEAPSAPSIPPTPVEPEFKTELPANEATVIDEQAEDKSADNSAQELPIDAQQDVPQASIEEIAPGQEQTEEAATQDLVVGTEGTVADSMNDGASMQPGVFQTSGFGMGFGLDASSVGGFPNMAGMGQGVDLNQMQMMMAMQNGMTPNAFGNFPMMGMPGMSMDPMAVQNMFMNGGFGGMNGMGMGMTGLDGGNGINNGWNQQSWNIGQDNYNHPNASGMGPGDYGANNSGFHTGYNQGNYGRRNQYNDYQQNGYGQGHFSRGRGRGRGYGFHNRGGYGYGQNEGYSHPNPQQFQNGTAQSDVVPPQTETNAAAPDALPQGNVDAFGRELREKNDEEHVDEAPTSVVEATTDSKSVNHGENIASETSTDQNNNQIVREENIPRAIQTLEQNDQSQTYQNGYHNNYSRVHLSNIPVADSAPNVPFNAPTGPKAMRERPPNPSVHSIRSRGIPPSDQTDYRPDSNGEMGTILRSRSGTPVHDRGREYSGSRSRSYSRSRSPSQDRRRKRRRHRSTSQSDSGRDDEHRRERRKRHSRRHEDDRDDRNGINIDETVNELANGTEPEASRSQSVAESRRSGHHRSRRDRDHDNGRDRDRDHKSSSHKHRSSHRPYRDRSRSRSRHRDRSRKRRHRHRHEDESSQDTRRRNRDQDRDQDRERTYKQEQDESQVPERNREQTSQTLQASPVDAPSEPTIPSGPRSMTLSNAFSATPVTGSNGKPNSIEINIRGAASNTHPRTSLAAQGGGSSIEQDLVNATRAARYKDRELERERDKSGRRREEKDRDRFSSRGDGRNDRGERSGVPTGPSAGRYRQDSSSTTAGHNGSASATITPGSAPVAVDPHTLEREKRNRERLLKEAQRIAGLGARMAAGSAGVGRKRAAAGGDLEGEGEQRTRKRGGGMGRGEREGSEARIARLEGEREGGRWD